MSTLKVGALQGFPENNNVISLQSGHQIYQPGMVVGMYRHDWFNLTDATTSTWINATNGSITISPKFATSNLLVVAELALAPYNSTNTYTGMSARILRDGAIITRQNQTHEVYFASAVANGADLYTRTVKSAWVPANSKNSTTFSIQIASYAATNSGRLNQGENWSSNITIWEVAG